MDPTLSNVQEVFLQILADEFHEKVIKPEEIEPLYLVKGNH